MLLSWCSLHRLYGKRFYTLNLDHISWENFLLKKSDHESLTAVIHFSLLFNQNFDDILHCCMKFFYDTKYIASYMLCILVKLTLYYRITTRIWFLLSIFRSMYNIPNSWMHSESGVPIILHSWNNRSLFNKI